MEPGVFPRARLGVLGGFDVTFDDVPLTVSRTAQRLLALLAVCYRERPAPRASVAEMLWPDAAPERAASSLRSVLWRLPRPRGRMLVVGSAAQVRLSDHLLVDLWRGEEQARRLATQDDLPPEGPSEDDLATLARDLLPTWHEEWLPVEQEAYRQRRLHALEGCARWFLERERFTDALSAALCAVGTEPLRESAHCRVIEVHLAEGNQAEALRQYDGYRRLLAQELGLPPSPVIRALMAPLLGRPLDGRRARR